MSNSEINRFPVESYENDIERDKGGNTVENVVNLTPRLPPSTRPPPPWSRRARQAAIESSKTPNDEASAPHTMLSSPYEVQHRSIYLGYNCFESARAHWFLYIPSLSQSQPGENFSHMGKVIQVTGNPFTGFGFQIKLNHNATQQPDTHYLLLGHVSPDIVVDDYKPDPSSGPEFRDQPLLGDRLEKIAFDLGLPYRDTSAVLPPPGDPIWLKPHPQFERCQEWMRHLIKLYVDEGILPSTAMGVPDKAISVGLQH